MKYSYVSLLTTDDYLPGVLVINKCLELTKATIPYVVCITDKISEDTKEILEKNNINTFLIEEIKTDRIKSREAKWDNTWTKLNIFNLTQFDKIVYIDADMLVCQNLDHLFTKEHFSGVDAGSFVKPDWTYLNSGLMVIVPNEDEYKNIMKVFLNSNSFQGDQCVLGKYDPLWSTKKHLNLGHQYNILAQSIRISVLRLKFILPLNIDQINEKWKPYNFIKIIHYHMDKPWNSLSEFLKFKGVMRLSYKLWYQMYSKVEHRIQLNKSLVL